MDCTKDGCRARLQVNGAQGVAICPQCRSPNCLSCRAVHEGLSCRKYRMSVQHKQQPPRKRTAQNNNTGFTSSAAMGTEKSPRQPATPAATPVAATDDDSSEKHVLCEVVGCGGQAFVDKADSLFRCPLCRHYTCLNCEAVHESLTCAEYQNNKDDVAPTFHKPRRQSEEDDDQVEDEEEQKEPPADDDAEGMIVECRYADCKGYAYVFKTATMAQCELCKHWTCVSCKACHESQSCAQYKGIEIPEENAAPEPTDGSGTENELPAFISHLEERLGGCIFDAGMLSGARGHSGHKKVQIEVFND